MTAIIAVSQAVVIPGAGIVAPGLAHPAAYGGYPAAYGGYPGLGYPAIAKVAAPLAVAKVAAAVDDYDPNPQYSYSYDINVRSLFFHTFLSESKLICSFFVQ